MCPQFKDGRKKYSHRAKKGDLERLQQDKSHYFNSKDSESSVGSHSELTLIYTEFATLLYVPPLFYDIGRLLLTSDTVAVVYRTPTVPPPLGQAMFDTHHYVIMARLHEWLEQAELYMHAPYEWETGVSQSQTDTLS